MKIYEYSYTMGGAKVKEIEAEEKEKTYKLNRGSGWRTVVRKNEIGQLMDGYALNMYLTERDDEIYINELIKLQEKKVISARATLAVEEKLLEKYKKINVEGGTEK